MMIVRVSFASAHRTRRLISSISELVEKEASEASAIAAESVLSALSERAAARRLSLGNAFAKDEHVTMHSNYAFSNAGKAVMSVFFFVRRVVA